MKLRTVPHQKLNPHKFCKYVALLLLIVFQYTTVRAEADDYLTNTTVGGFNCESECHDIGDDDSDKTDISTVTASWFEDCVRVFGTLYINQNTTLSSARMLMMPGSEIVVESDYTLLLVSSYLTGCDTLWRGIRVESSAYLNCFSDTIIGANAAIFLENRATVQVRGCRFENNYIGVATAMPYDVSSTYKEISGRFFIGNVFTNTAILLKPYTGHYYAPDWPSSTYIPYNRDFAAVYLRRTAGLNIGLDVAVASLQNRIENLRNGVVLDSSIADVIYCDIDDLLGTKTQSTDVEDLTSTGIFAWASTVRIRKNDLDDLQDGIVSLASRAEILENNVRLKILSNPIYQTTTRGIYIGTASEPTNALDNTVEEGDVGIYLNGGFTSEVKINDNVITSETEGAGRIGIQVNEWKSRDGGEGEIKKNDIDLTDVGIGTGIWITIAGRIEVDSNDVTFERKNENDAEYTAGIRTLFFEDARANKNTFYGEGDYASTDHYGIFYENSPNNSLFCNYNYNFSRGFTGSGMCNKSHLISNVFDISNPLGLELLAPTRIDEQEYNGNTWGGDDHDSYGAYISGSLPTGTAQNSTFIIDDDGMCLNWPCPIGPAAIASSWFIDLTGTAKTCASGPIDPLTDDDYEDVLMDPGEFGTYEDQMTWMTKAWIFEAILLDEDLLENTRLDSFYDADDTEPLGVLVSADFDIHAPFDNIAELEAIAEEIMDSLEVIVWIDEELYNLSADSNALRGQRDDAVEEIILLQEDRIELLADAAADHGSALSSAESALGSLTTDTDFEEYYKRALLYKIEWETDGPSSLSSSDWEEIQEIATLCTWEGGKAAALAQSLCAVARDSIVGPAETCTGVEPRSTQSSIDMEYGDLTVYPNPSELGWYVELPSGASEVILFDLTGRVLHNKNTSADKMFLPALDLLSGFYLIQVRDREGKIMASRKIVLQR